jgi:thioredoxin reductase (NADPH)
VGLDDKGFIVTGDDAGRHQSFGEHRDGDDRQPLLLETTRPGVFAVGDVRSGSTKRVASAVGDGALVVRSVHEALNRNAAG